MAMLFCSRQMSGDVEQNPGPTTRSAKMAIPDSKQFLQINYLISNCAFIWIHCIHQFSYIPCDQ